MKVSIIIPVYNVAPYIKRCLLSVAEQTYSNIECILVDDCGNDNSIQIAQKFIRGYNGGIVFKVIHHKENKGVATARNTGIKDSTGDLLFFLDSDDTITKDCIEKLILLYTKYPDIDLAQGNALSEKGGISKFGCHYDIKEHITDKEELYKHLLSLLTTVPWNRLVRRSIIIEHSIFFPDGKVYEDMFWVYFITKHIKSAAFTTDGTYVYYTNENSFMNSKTTITQQIHRYTSRLEEAQVYLNDLKKDDNSSKYQRQYLAVNLLSCLTELNSLKSFLHWTKFWYYILYLSLQVTTHIKPYRILFFICLIPPLCFVANKESFRWRIQQKIISHV